MERILITAGNVWIWKEKSGGVSGYLVEVL